MFLQRRRQDTGASLRTARIRPRLFRIDAQFNPWFNHLPIIAKESLNLGKGGLYAATRRTRTDNKRIRDDYFNNYG
jgi:hypothetical protein